MASRNMHGLALILHRLTVRHDTGARIGAEDVVSASAFPSSSVGAGALVRGGSVGVDADPSVPLSPTPVFSASVLQHRLLHE